MDNSIISYKEYGHIEIDLQRLMDERGITRNQLARMINARYEVVGKWYKGDLERLDTDILARICYVLKCNVEDIIHYVQ